MRYFLWGNHIKYLVIKIIIFTFANKKPQITTIMVKITKEEALTRFKEAIKRKREWEKQSTEFLIQLSKKSVVSPSN